jgi:hypothetical protein
MAALTGIHNFVFKNISAGEPVGLKNGLLLTANIDSIN